MGRVSGSPAQRVGRRNAQHACCDAQSGWRHCHGGIICDWWAAWGRLYTDSVAATPVVATPAVATPVVAAPVVATPVW